MASKNNHLPSVLVSILLAVCVLLLSFIFTVKPMAAENEEASSLTLDASELTTSLSASGHSTPTGGAVITRKETVPTQGRAPLSFGKVLQRDEAELTLTEADMLDTKAADAAPSPAFAPSAKLGGILSAYLSQHDYCPLPGEEAEEETVAEEESTEDDYASADEYTSYDDRFSETDSSTSSDSSEESSQESAPDSSESSSESSSGSSSDSSSDSGSDNSSDSRSEESSSGSSEESSESTESSGSAESSEPSSESTQDSSQDSSQESSQESSEDSSQDNSQDSSQESSQESSGSEESSETTSYTDLDYLAAICQAEAGSDYDGDLAVANVVLNRVKDSRFGDTIYDVIFAPYQFAASSAMRRLENGTVSQTAYQAAQDALNGASNFQLRQDYLFFNSAAYKDTSTIRGEYEIIGGNVFYYYYS